MKRELAQRGKTGITLMALAVIALLGGMAVFFVATVQEQLWQQSITTILESTQQGGNTLRVQLEGEYRSMGAVAAYLGTLSADQADALNEVVDDYGHVDGGISLYLTDGTSFPAGAPLDEAAVGLLPETGAGSGIIDPHISTVTGVNVFNLYQRVELKNGAVGYLLKEYEVDGIVDSFTVSFYHDAGFSYVMNTGGDILIRPPHPNSNKTIQNLFDMLPEEANDPDSLGRFRESLRAGRMGWAVFAYQGADTVFCYIPLGLGSDWYLLSMIPRDVVNAQTNEILTRTFTLVAGIVLGIALLVAVYFRYANRANRRLRSQADYIGHLYNAVPEGIALLTVDEPYRFLQLNQEGLRLLGYPQDAANDAPREVHLQSAIHPDDYAAMAELMRATASFGGKNRFESRAVRADGTLFWIAGLVEKTLDEDETPVLIATFHDSTAEKLAEEAAEREMLQERTMLVRAISNAYPVIISLNLTRDTLKFLYVQQGLMIHMGGQTSYSQLYREFSGSIHPDYAEGFRRRFAPERLLESLGQERNETFGEVRQQLTDGQYHWISIQIISVDNPYSDEKLAILLSRRIDEQRYEETRQRQALESALENAKAASLAKSQFLSNMSHDIRTPMNAIVGMTEIAATHLGEPGRVAECLRKIGLSSQHLLELINDILDMSKIESGKLSLREEPLNLAALASEVLELLRPQAAAGRVELQMQLAAMRDEDVVGDPLRIRQVYLNILSNAVKYTPEGGRVSVEVRQEDSRRKGYQNYVFRCADTGEGMSEAFLQKLYQPFEREQEAASGKAAGTGLGLAITKNLVDMMGGDIHVRSRLGEGSVFTVTLPLRTRDAGGEDLPPEWAGVRCLVVDGDEKTGENAAALLKSAGLRAERADCGTAARLVAQAAGTADPFGLVLLDWDQPGLDGAETVRRIRDEAGAALPVVGLTAGERPETRTDGVTLFLPKPFYRSRLCEALRDLSGGAPAAEEQDSGWMDCTGSRVLLVEDNAMNREIARVLLEETGAAVEEAHNGAEAVRMVADAAAGYYDLILMDIQMPVMDGYAAARAIRGLDRPDAADIPIVAMTANAMEEDVRSALRAGMNAHFSKPIHVGELQNLLRRYLHGPGETGGRQE